MKTYFRQLVLIVALMLLCSAFRINERFVFAPILSTVSKANVPPARSPELTSSLSPVPVVEPKLNMTVEMTLPSSASEPANDELPAELNVDDALPTHTLPALPEDDGHFARYLDRRARADTFLFSHDRQPKNDNWIALGKLQVGYGRIFRDDSLIVRGRNESTREEPGCLYVMATFRF